MGWFEPVGLFKVYDLLYFYEILGKVLPSKKSGKGFRNPGKVLKWKFQTTKGIYKEMFQFLPKIILQSYSFVSQTLFIFYYNSIPLSICTRFLQFSSLKYQVWWIGFLVYFKLEFYRLKQAEKSSSNWQKNPVHQTWYFTLENCKS